MPYSPKVSEYPAYSLLEDIEIFFKRAGMLRTHFKMFSPRAWDIWAPKLFRIKFAD